MGYEIFSNCIKSSFALVSRIKSDRSLTPVKENNQNKPVTREKTVESCRRKRTNLRPSKEKEVSDYNEEQP